MINKKGNWRIVLLVIVIIVLIGIVIFWRNTMSEAKELCEWYKQECENAGEDYPCLEVENYEDCIEGNFCVESGYISWCKNSHDVIINVP